MGISPIEQPAIQPGWRVERTFGVGTRIAFCLVMHPIQVTFRNMSAHEALSEAVRSRARWLETFDPDVTGCRVALEFPHRHKKHGRPLSIHIHVSLPGEDVTVRHETVLHQSAAALYEADTARGDHRDAITAINDAFDIARRRLEDVARRRRGD